MVVWKDGTGTKVPSKAKRPWEILNGKPNEDSIPPVMLE